MVPASLFSPDNLNCIEPRWNICFFFHFLFLSTIEKGLFRYIPRLEILNKKSIDLVFNGIRSTGTATYEESCDYLHKTCLGMKIRPCRKIEELARGTFYEFSRRFEELDKHRFANTWISGCKYNVHVLKGSNFLYERFKGI